uniref:Uncharacterized protein n=1 Tax=Astyanax mexicanus TaxID=7994 RepID=W5K668_ASTMX
VALELHFSPLCAFFLARCVNYLQQQVIKKHGQYSCEGRNLTYIPTSLPSSVKILDFSLNFLPTLKRSVFPQLYNLQHLDLTR